jgi:hypothetical protein
MSGVNNKKGETFEERFIDVISDPNNTFIPRDQNAGMLVDGIITMHNGIKIEKDCYYGDFSRIFVINKGVHEPSEERMFRMILDDISEGGTMIELGSYWAFYSIWFNKTILNAKNYCIEPELSNLNTGKRCAALNDAKLDFTHGFIGKNQVNICNFIKEKNISNIDILHSDIQGFELEMLQDAVPLLVAKKIKYLFISTHSNSLHYACIDLLKANNYRIIASADVDNETFCYDGIIVACHIDNIKFGIVDLGNRKVTQLRSTPYF